MNSLTTRRATPPTRSNAAPRRYSYADLLSISERIGWKVEDLIGGDRRLDFTRPFLPEALAGTESLTFLSAQEKLTLNHIRGYGYLRMFVVVEAFILPFLLEHARGKMAADDAEIRALLQFAGEEAKHTDLFNRFRAEFEREFGSPCGFIGPQEDIVGEVLRHHPLGVALVILMAEWMTQAHYVESVKNTQELDPLFASMLKHHWMEEAQHAKLDTLITEAMFETYAPAEVEHALDEFFAVGAFIDGGLQQQVELDLESFECATGRVLTPAEREAFSAAQLRAQRWTFLGSGMVHPRFHETLEVAHPDAKRRVQEAAPSFS
jgi:hypothetical protein